MFDAVRDQLSGVDILINNAAIARQSLFTDVSYDEWRNTFSVNVDGMFLCCREALPHMLRMHAGSIVNLSSMWGQVGASCEVLYSATKAAVIGLTKALAQEVGPSGIRVNCVAPGVIDTAMNSHLSGDDLKALADAGIKPTVVIVPMEEGHLVQPLFPHLKHTKRFYMRPRIPERKVRGVRVLVFW